jgi:RNA polymerase sigma factor (sigma-70 family)
MENIDAIKKGNQKIFGEVFETFHEKVFGFFMQRNNKDRELSKELTQLTFIKLWQSKHTLSESFPFDKQLFIMAKHTLIDFIRKEAIQAKTKDVLNKKSLLQPVMADFSDTMFEGNDYVITQLKVLPPVRKKVLQMKVLYGYSNKQIASSLSISIKTVEDHITKGLNELRSHATLSLPLIAFFILQLA